MLLIEDDRSVCEVATLGQGGELAVDNEPGRGAGFTLRLRRADRPDGATRATRPGGGTSADVPAAGR